MYKQPHTVYVSVSDKTVATTKEVIKNQIFADFDDSGKLVGFEFLKATSVKVDGVENAVR